MSTIKYIGRTTDFRGQTLWEIVGNLRNYGVGRMVVRNMFQRYEEPCYMRILKVEAVNSEPDNARKVRVTVEKTWRGVTLPKPIVLYSTTYKADYELVPKSAEARYLQNAKKVQERVIPNQFELPPLLREFITQETGVQEPTMPVHFKPCLNKFARVEKAKEQSAGDQSKLTMGLGKPASPKLYDGVL